MNPVPPPSAAQLAPLFPFLVAFDRTMRLVEVGPAWARLCPSVAPGATVGDLFRQTRPDVPLTWEDVAARSASIFLLECLPITLALRGQMVAGDGDTMLFLGFPWITDIAELGRHGLTMSDFPPHVATTDLLFLLQARNVALDDTRRLAEKLEEQRAAVRRSEERVRRIIDTALDAVVSMDQEGRICGWNRQAESMFGWSADEAMGRSLGLTIIPPFLRGAHEHGLARFLETGEGPVLGRRVEIDAMDRSGGEFPVELTITAVREEGKFSFHAFVRDIRDRKAAEKELRESRERLNLAVEGANVGIWDWNVETGEILGNDRWSTLLGYEPGEIPSTGNAWRNAMHPDDRARGLRQIGAHLRRRTPFYESEVRLRAKNGEWRWILSHGRVVARDASGRALRATGVLLDVTKRKRSEQALAAQLEVTRVLAESTTLEEAAPRILEAIGGILEWDTGGLWTTPPGATELSCVHAWTGGRPEYAEFAKVTRSIRFARGVGLPGRVWESRAPAWIPDIPADTDFLRRAEAADAGLHSGVALPIRTGHVVSGVLDFFSREKRGRDEEREELMLSLASQIGQFLERRRSEAALRTSEARTRRILDTALDGVISMDTDGRITAWNAQASQIFGREPAEVLGLSLAETIVPPSLRDSHVRGLARYLATGEGPVLNQRIEVPALHRDGREFPVELSITPLTGSGPVQFNAFVRDITERKRAEAELAGAKEAAETANAVKSRFLATMSHEIRTPLNPILGMTSLLLDDQPTDEQRRYLQRIRQSGELLLRLINEILDFSKVEAGRIELEDLCFDPREVLDHVTDLFAVEAQDKRLDLATRVADDIPRAVRGDPGRIQQVLSNLVTNAIKFTEQGGVLVNVALENTAEGDPTLAFRVHDTGIGIPEDKRESLFEPFTQADASTTRRFGGSGLGLAIARGLARRMGGDIEVHSDRAGSTFLFRVPVVACEEGTAALPVAATPRRAPQRRARILVAEDNAANQEVVLLMLRRLGHSVDVVGDGDEAIAAFRRAPYTLVLMDCQMPGKDGFEATRAIRRLEKAGLDRRRTDAGAPPEGTTPAPARTPIIAMTAFAVAGDRERCLEAGMDDYIAKPVQFEQLLDMLEQHLGESVPADDAAPAGEARVPELATVGRAFDAAAPAVDEAVLARLRALETPERPLVARLVSAFLDSTPGVVGRMTARFDAGDDAGVARLAHDLKTESGNLGARPLSALASTLQDVARAGRHDRVGEVLSQLRVEADRACAVLRTLFPDLADPASNTTDQGEPR